MLCFKRRISGYRKSVAAMALLVVVASALPACGGDSKEASGSGEKITIGTTGGFYPYVFKNTETNKLEGFEVDVWEAIAKETGYTIEWQTSEFSGLFGLLDSGKIDTIANSISVTDERKLKYLFDEPYVYSGAQLVVKEGNDAIRSLEDLKGKKIAIQVGTNFVNHVKNFDKNGEIEIVNYESADAGYQDVALGRVDATFATKASALGTIKKTGLPLQLGGKQFNVIPAANPFLKNEKNEERVQEVNRALEKLRENGTLSKLSEKWYTEDLTNPE